MTSIKITGLLVITLSFFLFSCSPDYYHHSPSVVELNLSDEKYVGRQIKLRGYLGYYLGNESPLYLYASTDDFKMKNHRMAVFLHIDRAKVDLEKCLHQFVTVSGTYSNIDLENFEQQFGITDIAYIIEIPEDMSQSEEGRTKCFWTVAN